MVAVHFTTSTIELVIVALIFLCCQEPKMPQRVYSGKPRAAAAKPRTAPAAPELTAPPPPPPPGRLVNHLTSVHLDLVFTDYQLSRLRSGCTSLPYNESLATIAMAHTIAKELNQDEIGDMFQREVYVEYQGEAAQGSMNNVDRKVDCLYGPTMRLCPSLSRVIIFKQTKPATSDIPLMPNGLCSQCHLHRDVPDSCTEPICVCCMQEPLQDNGGTDYFVHCIYDNLNACFVDPVGNCLFVKRDQLKYFL